MRKMNEVDVIEPQKAAMTIRKGDKTIEFSPEVSQQICAGMISLGTQLISDTGKTAVEYFKTQANMYYGELNAYISNQTLKSNERKEILKLIEKLTEKYSSLINETSDADKQEQLKEAYNFFIEKHTKLYTEALTIDTETTIPKRPDLLSGIRRLFSKN